MFFVNVTITFFSQVISLLSSAFNNIIIARNLGPAGQGITTLALNLANILVMFGSLGLTWSNTYWVSKKRITTNIIFLNSAVFSLIVMMVMAIFLKSRIIYSATVFLNPVFLRIVLLAVPVIIFMQLNQSVLLGLQKIIPYNLISVFRSIFFTLFLLFFLVMLKLSVPVAIWLWFYSCVCVCLLSVWLTVRQIPDLKFRIDIAIFIESIKTGIRVFLLTVISFLVMRVDLFIIQYFKGAESVGYYSISVLIAEMLFFVPQIFGQLISPKGSAREVGSSLLALRVNRITATYSFLTSFIILLFVRPILLIFFGRSYLAAQQSVLLLLPGIIALNSVSTMSFYICGKEGYPKKIILAMLAGLIINVCLNILFIPRFSINGAAIASSLAYMASAALCLNYFYYQQGIRLSDLLVLKRDDVLILRGKIKMLLSRKK